LRKKLGESERAYTTLTTAYETIQTQLQVTNKSRDDQAAITAQFQQEVQALKQQIIDLSEQAASRLSEFKFMEEASHYEIEGVRKEASCYMNGYYKEKTEHDLAKALNVDLQTKLNETQIQLSNSLQISRDLENRGQFERQAMKELEDQISYQKQNLIHLQDQKVCPISYTLMLRKLTVTYTTWMLNA